MMNLFKSQAGSSPRISGALAKLFTDPDRAGKELIVKPDPPSAITFNPKYFFWNMRNLAISEATKHMAIFGTTGAGKSIAFALFLQSIAPRLTMDGPDACRVIYFDAKCDAVPRFDSFGLGPENERVWIMNPFDKRGSICSLADAAREPAYIRYMGKQMIPEEKNSNAPFWHLAAQQLGQAGAIALNKIKDGWSLRDYLCSLSSRESILGVAARDSRAKETAKQILDDERHSAGVIATLWTKLARFEETAALWEKAIGKKTFSVKEFLQGPGVLILGNDPVLNESIQPINRLILKMVTDELLRGPETDRVHTFFVFDECPALGKTDFLPRLLSEGRSKGVSVLIGTQAIERLTDIYGDAQTETILGQCGHKMFLRAGSAKSAEWAEKHFGKIRQMETSYSETFSGGNVSRSFQYNLKERSLFLSSVFLDLPFPTCGTYHSINDVPSLGSTFVTRRPFAEILSWLKPLGNAPAIVRRTDPGEQFLAPWDDEEKKRFFGRASEEGSQPYLPPRRRKPTDDSNQQNLF
jgi:type IV secretory pathway TraG/TraD family ATPase VirD4